MCFGTSHLSESSQQLSKAKKLPSFCQVWKWRAEGFSSGSPLSVVEEEAGFELGTLTHPSSLHHRAQSPSCWSPWLPALRRGSWALSQLIDLLLELHCGVLPPGLSSTRPRREVLDPVLPPGHPGSLARLFSLLWSPFPVCPMLRAGLLYIYNCHFQLWPLLLLQACRPGLGRMTFLHGLWKMFLGNCDSGFPSSRSPVPDLQSR